MLATDDVGNSVFACDLWFAVHPKQVLVMRLEVTPQGSRQYVLDAYHATAKGVLCSYVFFPGEEDQ